MFILYLPFCSRPLWPARQSRLERMAEFQQRGEDLENNSAECKSLLQEAREQLAYLEERMKEGDEDEEREAELKKVQAKIKKLEEDEKSFEKLLEEHRREEKKLPWDVDTISKDGFSKVTRGHEVQSDLLGSWFTSCLTFFCRVYLTLSLHQRRMLGRKRWRPTRPLWRSMQKKSNTLVSKLCCLLCLPSCFHTLSHPTA